MSEQILIVSEVFAILVIMVIIIYFLKTKKKDEEVNTKENIQSIEEDVQKEIAKEEKGDKLLNKTDDKDNNDSEKLFETQQQSKIAKTTNNNETTETDKVNEILNKEFQDKLSSFIRQEIETAISSPKISKVFEDKLESQVSNIIKRIEESLENRLTLNEGTESKTTSNVVIKELKSINQRMKGIEDFNFEKNEIIKRYEDGYDRKLTKSMEREIFRILDYIYKEKNSSKIIEDIRDDLEILLFNRGIEKIETIKKGEKYKASKFLELERHEPTNDEGNNDKISKISRCGYYYVLGIDENGEEEFKLIRPTRVIVYKYENRNPKGNKENE